MTAAGISEVILSQTFAGVLSPLTLERLARMPGQGGTHLWLAQVAGGLKRVLKPDACERFLARCCEVLVTHRQVPLREIEAAVTFAYGSSDTSTHGPVWPEARPDLIAKALAEAAAPLFDGVTDTGVSAVDALAALFKPGELVCAGTVCERPAVRLLQAWPDADEAQFVCPNPLKGPSGLTKDGRPSVRCQSNIAERRWIIAEFDNPALNKGQQAKIASVLARGLPLRLVVDSGGKSLHCWFSCEGVEEHAVAKFFWLACALGADPSRWDPCGWVRMPGGLRRKADGLTARQRVVFFKQGGA